MCVCGSVLVCLKAEGCTEEHSSGSHGPREGVAPLLCNCCVAHEYNCHSVSIHSLSVCLSVCLSVHLCLSVCLSVCLCVYLSVHLSVCLSVCLCVYLSVHLSVSVYLCICDVCVVQCSALLLASEGGDLPTPHPTTVVCVANLRDDPINWERALKRKYFLENTTAFQ